MPDEHRVETPRRYDGHTEKDQGATRKGPELGLKARIFVAKDEKDDQYQQQADHDGNTGTEQESGDRG